MANGRILFLYENEAPFVFGDLSILREEFDVHPIKCSQGWNLRGALSSLRQSDLSYSWFARGYATRAVLLGKMLARPSVVVAGGWDVIASPEIGYGDARTRRGKARARFILRHADLLLTFSDWSRQTIQNLSGRRAELVYLGVDVEKFHPRAPKDDLVVTVGNVTRENFARKGIETFVRAAAQLRDVRFVLVGKHQGEAASALRAIATPNVELPGWLPDEELRDLLARAQVYVQVSYNEGFGLALAEAMASGCVPVVTRQGALPEVAGEFGFYVPFGDAPATATAIREALTSDRGEAARERMATRFSFARRREHLLALVQGLLGN